MADLYLDCRAEYGAGIGKLTLTGTATYINVELQSSAHIHLSGSATLLLGLLVPGIVGYVQFDPGPLTDFYVESPKKNWVAWSNIGRASFVIGQGNVAGERPLMFRGWVYKLLQLGKTVVAYGEDGIVQLSPVNEPTPTWGARSLFPLGIKGRNAVCGDDEGHYFIAKNGELYHIENTANKLMNLGDKGFKSLGYEEFLRELNDDLVMFVDPLTQYVHICDATKGYVLTPYGLGAWFGGVTGLESFSGVTTLIAPQTLEPAEPELTTQTIDLAFAGLKTLSQVDVVVDTTKQVFVSCLFRYSRDEAWRVSREKLVNEQGSVFPFVTAAEFRIRVRVSFGEDSLYEYVEVKKLTAKFKYADKRFERPRHWSGTK